MSELPKGWIETKVTVICERVRGVSYDKIEVSHEGKEAYVPILRANNINNDRLTFEDLQFVPSSRVSEKQKLRPNDVIVAMSSGSKSVVGKTAQLFQEWNGSFGAFCGVLRPSSEIDGKYFGYFFRTRQYRTKVSDLSAGTSINNLRNEHFEGMDFPIPPLTEQRRIVAKLEKLLVRVDAAQERLAMILRTLKRFRQSLLAAACSGRLTAGWRQENMEIHPATELLSQIKTVRLEKASGNKETIQIQTAFSNNSGDSDKELELPPTWAFCSIGAIGAVSNGSTPRRNIPEYWGGNIHWVSSGEVNNNIISTTRERITKRGYEESSVRILPAGTVLLAMIGEGKTRGQSAILMTEATINQNIAAIDLSHGYLVPAYLWRWFQYQYATTRERGSGSGPQALNCQRVRELPLFLPPLAEQQEIIRRVEAVFKTIDVLEARYLNAKTHIDKLTQSILARAFRGELVPQDPNDEPASALLQRMRSEQLSERKKHGQRVKQ